MCNLTLRRYFIKCSLFLLVIFSSSVFSYEIGQKLTITLHTNDSESQDIGWLTILESRDDGFVYDLTLDDDQFETHFLSMAPFKCLESPEKMVCYLPYPYQNNRFIAEGNLIDLEYDLLFLHKEPGEYGIDPWNGIYYKLKLEAGTISGVLHDIDLDVIKAPPEKGNLRPIKENMLHKANLNNHWFPKVVIQ